MSLIAYLKNYRPYGAWALGVIAVAICSVKAAEAPKMLFSGAGWMQYGVIAKSSDTTGGKDLNGRSLIGTGAQFSLTVNPSERLRIEAGLGAAMGHSLAGTPRRQGGYAPVGTGPYVSNANFQYSLWNEERAKLSFRGGLFPYDYNPDAQNLGLYLLRGPVYPGYVLSGFETKYVLPVANTLGFQVHHQTGGLEQDLLFTFETQFYPYWDMSPAYVANYNFGKVFRIGAGVNFYHLVPIDSKLTTDTTNVFIDTVPAVDDTINISFKGTKVMANGSLDVKALVGGMDMLGPEDLKIYSEIALLGLDNGAKYKRLFGNYSNRMPVMVGMNLPAFKLLDRLSLEVEYYSAKFVDDLTGYNTYGAPSPYPIGKLDTNYSADNIKWSLYASKVVQNHIKISMQAASDHFRPGVFKGYGDNNPPSMEAVLFKPSEWYWNMKVAYFF